MDLHKATHALILGRPSDYWQWADKIDEFTDSKYTLVEAKNKASRTYRPGEDIRYTIVPWSLFRRDYDVISGFPWDIVVADEAQEFRNNNTKTGHLIKRLNSKVKPTYRWALTGTAIGTKLEELYSIMYWVDAGFLPLWPEFEENHIVRNELGQIYKYKNLKALNEYLQPRMDRKTHADLKGQMPELVRQTHKIPATAAYLRAQKKLLDILDAMAENLHFDEDGNLESTHPDGKVSKAFKSVRKSLYAAKHKYIEQLIRDLLVENEANKIVVFCTNKYPLYDLGECFRGLETYFTGDQSSAEKRNAIAEFKQEKRILFASNAGKAGLDLNFANYVIHIDVVPSYEVRDQRDKRITRAGSSFDTVVAITVLLEDSIEEFYYVIGTNRGRLASAVKEGTEDEVIMRPSSLRQFIKEDDRGKTGHQETSISKRVS